MLLVQYGYIFLVLIFLLLFSSPKGSENKETKISELGKYISYCTLSRAITITYLKTFFLIVFATSCVVYSVYITNNLKSVFLCPRLFLLQNIKKSKNFIKGIFALRK